MKEYLKPNKKFIKFLPMYLVILALVTLMGTSYALLRSSHLGDNSYTLNVANLEVTFLDSQTNSLTLTKAYPITDEEGIEQDDYLEFTIKNTGTALANYTVHIDELSTSPAFKNVINYIVKKSSGEYGSVVNLGANNIVDTGVIAVGETITYRIKCWIKAEADETYMGKTFSAKVVVDSGQAKTYDTILFDENKNGIADIGEILKIGTERFYVYKNDGTNIKALAMYNILVGNTCSSSSSCSPLLNPTGLQDSSAIGYHYAPGTRTAEYPTIGTTEFSNENQKGTNYSDYEGSIVEGYVNDYKLSLERMGANINNATLISKEEIEVLINDGNSLSAGYINTLADPLNMQWLYKTTYWTRSASSGHYLWSVNSYSHLYDGPSSYDYGRGVRPAIEVSLSNVKIKGMEFVNQINTEVQEDTGIKFYNISSSTNGEGLYMLSSTSNDEYPIYYYRGNVNNNNIYFAENCWKIVRTTSTGGLKLIYNGEATDVDGKKQCLQTTGTGTQLPTTKEFNSSWDSPAGVGYSLPSSSSIYTYSSNTLSSGVYYGSSIDQTTYELVDPQTTLDNNHHYSYNSTDIHATGISGDTGNVRYYHYYNPSSSTTAYFIKFAKTKSIQTILNEMLSEPVSKENPSTIQGVINTWWSSYDATYGSYLEDTEWCNDRSIGELNGWNPNGGDLTKYLYFSSYVRYNQGGFGSNPNNIKNTNQPILTCNNVNDKLTVSNGSLTYKLGLLTYDEVAMAGAVYYTTSNSNYYLYTNSIYWLLTPSYFFNHSAFGGYVHSYGYLNSSSVSTSYGARPAVSLKLGTTINSGDGTKENPYIVGE